MMMKTPAFGEKILVSLVTALQKQWLLYINCCCNNVKRNTDENDVSNFGEYFSITGDVTASQKKRSYCTSTVAVNISQGIFIDEKENN